MAARIIFQYFKNVPAYSRLIPCTSSLSAGHPILQTSHQLRPNFGLVRNFSTEEAETEENSEDSSVQPAVRDPAKDRSEVVPVEVSMRYMQSKAYETSYGNSPVWKTYGRNYKGHWDPDTRKTCVRQGMISTGNPCPICRDEYLVLDYRNVDLLKQFISPFNGAILPTKKTGLCQAKHKELLVAISKAKDFGLIAFDIPTRDYDYSDYRKK